MHGEAKQVIIEIGYCEGCGRQKQVSIMPTEDGGSRIFVDCLCGQGAKAEWKLAAGEEPELRLLPREMRTKEGGNGDAGTDQGDL